MRSKVYPGFTEKEFNVSTNEVKPAKQNLEILEGKDKKEFLRGAEIAYESILTSFATGDLIKLKNLLSSNMFSNFSEAIKSRNKEGIKSEFTFIGVKESSVEKYEKIKDNLFATVKFVAEVISVKKDKENKIVEAILIKLSLLLIVGNLLEILNKKILTGICLKLSQSDKEKRSQPRRQKSLGRLY